MRSPKCSMLAAYHGATWWSPGGLFLLRSSSPRQPHRMLQELLAPTAGVRWRIAGLVAIGRLIVAASLASFVFAGRAIAAVFAGRALQDFWFLITGAAVAAVVRGVLLHLRETAGERTAAGLSSTSSAVPP
jgi:hypothetical protein